MKKTKVKKEKFHTIKNIGRAFLYAAIILVPPMIPFFLLGYYHSAAPVDRGDMRVEIVQDVIENDYSEFTAARKMFMIGMYVDDLAGVDVGSRTFQSRFTYWAKNYFDKSANDRSVLLDDPFELVNAEKSKIESDKVRYIESEDVDGEYID